MELPTFEVITVAAVDPQTVACPETLLAVALQTLGVAGVKKQGRDCGFEIVEIPGERTTQVLWYWFFEPASACGRYRTADLIAWWKDDAWRAEHPTHELTLVHTVLQNMAEEARRIRDTEPRIVVRRGDLEARIPRHASPARRQHLLDQLEGRVAPGTPFQEPASAA